MPVNVQNAIGVIAGGLANNQQSSRAARGKERKYDHTASTSAHARVGDQGSVASGRIFVEYRFTRESTADCGAVGGEGAVASGRASEEFRLATICPDDCGAIGGEGTVSRSGRVLELRGSAAECAAGDCAGVGGEGGIARGRGSREYRLATICFHCGAVGGEGPIGRSGRA